ncbi:hypothetical protein [Pseudodesulfovibrio sediminis]|nr:hypothetical protein [Pseudodesulfovibrio sediminis]
MNKDALSAWYYVLQKGFALQGYSGMSVRNFFLHVLQYEEGFIEESVRTIFLNNSPVDDIDSVFLKEGDRMALGSAMPGLVGIVMGRDNPFKSFRSDISVHDAQADGADIPITISMKIFSTLAVETGRALLERGLDVDAEILAAFLHENKQHINSVNNMSGQEFVDKLRAMNGFVRIKVVLE